MAGNRKFEISSSSSDGSNFPGHFSSASNLKGSSSFRENLESLILPAGANFPGDGTSVHGEHLPLSEVLLWEDEKYHHSELIRVPNAVLSTVSEDPSLGSVQAKPLSSLGVEELKQVRTSVAENSLKARERINFLNEAISKLDKYSSPMLERNKRSETKLSAPNPISVDRSDLGGNLLKVGPQNHTASNWADLGSQRPDDRKSTVPNKGVRTCMKDMPVEWRPNNLSRLSVLIDRLERDRLKFRNTASQSEDKDRTLPTGSESWEKTKMEGRLSGMKSDVSINAVTNRLLDGDRDCK